MVHDVAQRVVKPWCTGGASSGARVALFKGKWPNAGDLSKGFQGKAEARLAGPAREPMGFWRKLACAP